MSDFLDDKTLAIVGLVTIAILAILYNGSENAFGLAENIVIAIGSFVTGIKMERREPKTPAAPAAPPIPAPEVPYTKPNVDIKNTKIK